MAQKADIEKRIATVEQASDLTKRIEATQRLVDASREKAATTEHKVSTVDHQNGFYAQTVSLMRTGSIKASETTEQTMNAAINVAMALAGTGLPALCFFVAGLYRNPREADDPTPINEPAVVTIQNVMPQTPPVQERPVPRLDIHTLTVADLLGQARAA